MRKNREDTKSYERSYKKRWRKNNHRLKKQLKSECYRTINFFESLQRETIGFVRYKIKAEPVKYGDMIFKYSVIAFTKNGDFLRAKLFCVKWPEVDKFIAEKSRELENFYLEDKE